MATSDAVSANAHARPLQGIRVVTIAQNLPGPLLVARLVEQGATATKVEPPNGDPFLSLSESWYGEMHAQVSVERVDLKSGLGRDRLALLLDGADVFVTSHRPSALARLGLSPDLLRIRHPRLRTLRLFGSTAEPETPGHDLTYQAHSGLLRDALPQALVADVMASERGFGAALLLLRQPEGTVIDVGLSESLDPLTACLRHGLTKEGGILGGGAPRYGVYPAKGGHVAVAALEPHFEARLYEALGQPVGSRLDAAFVGQSAAEWEAWARTRDLPIAAILSR